MDIEEQKRKEKIGKTKIGKSKKIKNFKTIIIDER